MSTYTVTAPDPEWRDQLALHLRIAESGDTIVVSNTDMEVTARTAASALYPTKQLTFTQSAWIEEQEPKAQAARREALARWVQSSGHEEAARHIVHLENRITGLTQKLRGLRKHVKQRAAHAEDQILRVPRCPHYTVCETRPPECLETFRKVSEAGAKWLRENS